MDTITDIDSAPAFFLDYVKLDFCNTLSRRAQHRLNA